MWRVPQFRCTQFDVSNRVGIPLANHLRGDLIAL
jgi:hypothetical protein